MILFNGSSTSNTIVKYLCDVLVKDVCHATAISIAKIFRQKIIIKCSVYNILIHNVILDVYFHDYDRTCNYIVFRELPVPSRHRICFVTTYLTVPASTGTHYLYQQADSQVSIAQKRTRSIAYGRISNY